MKTKLTFIFLFSVCILLMSGCSPRWGISKFSSEKVELGMDRSDLVKLFGSPFAKEMITTPDNHRLERLLYKETLLDPNGWYVLTTAFTFEGKKLMSQEVVNEERLDNNQDNNNNTRQK